MKKLSKDAEAVFRKIVELLGGKDNIKINNSTVYMPLSVEFLYEVPGGKIISLTHWLKQNGDLCRDPDCTFLVSADSINPLEFQQDLAGYYVEAARVEGGQLQIVDLKQYNSLIDFCTLWLRNIREQQSI